MMNRKCDVCGETFEVAAKKQYSNAAQHCPLCRVWWWYWSKAGSLVRWSKYTKRVSKASRRIHFRQNLRARKSA